MELPKSTFERYLTRSRTEKKGVKLDTELTADDMKELVVRFKAYYKRTEGNRFPLRAARAADRGRQGRVPQLGERARDHVYRRMNDIPLLVGHRSQRPVHGLRQYGRDQRHRRRLYAQPVHRREKAVRRVPHERAGRGRRGRHSHPAVDRAAAQEVMPEVYEQFANIAETLEKALSRHAGHGIHH